MAYLQIELNDEENKIVSLYKINHNFKTKQQAIKDMINKWGRKK